MKRFLALLLCLTMALSLLPAAAAEDIRIVDVPEDPGALVKTQDEPVPDEPEDEIAVIGAVSAEPEPAEPLAASPGLAEAPDAVAPGPDAEILASGSCGDDLTWTLDDDGVLAIKGSGAMTNYGSQGAPWYSYRSTIKKIQLWCEITTIGDFAFQGCNSAILDSNSGDFLPNNLTSIGECAFLSCYALTHIEIPYYVTDIGSQAFCYCKGLKKLTLCCASPSLGDWAFGYCTSLEEISFLNHVPTFSSKTFSSSSAATAWYPYDLTSWTEDVLQDYGGSISWKAGYHGWCGDNVSWDLNKSSGALTFSGTGSTWNYCLMMGNDWVGVYTPFNPYRRFITSIKVDNGIERLGRELMCLLDQATSIRLPESLKQIDFHAFSMLNSLTSITLPRNLEKMENAVFYPCPALTEVRFQGHVPTSLNANTFLGITATVYYYPVYSWTSDKLKDYGGTLTWVKDDKIGDNVTWALTSSSQPNYSSMRLFGTGATWEYPQEYPGFYWFREECAFIYVSEGITELGSYLFWGLRPDGGEVCFFLPKTLKVIGNRAFGYCGTMNADFYRSAPSFGNYVFQNCDTVLASYPANDSSWSAIVDLSGDAGSRGAKNLVWARNYVGDDLWLYPLPASESGTASFRAENNSSRAMLVAVNNSGSYSRLTSGYTGTSENYGLYDLSLSARVMPLSIALKGDANLDGKLESRDGNMVSRAAVGKYIIADPLAKLAADVDGNGKIESRDGNMVSRAAVNKYKIPW